MNRRPLSIAAILGTAVALSAPVLAQFRPDLGPTAFRAAQQQPKQNNDPVPGRMNALSPLGGKQGTPVNKPVGEAAKPIGSYAGTPDQSGSGSSTDPLARPGIGVTGGKADDTTVDDPNKPRQPLKPNSIKKGVAPRS